MPDLSQNGVILLPSITEEMAKRIANNIVEIAKKDGKGPISVCILDIKREKKCKISMDGVLPISVRLSFDKAFTAVMIECSTRKFKNILKDGNATTTDFSPNFTALAGGIPIVAPLDNNEYVAIGSIGVSDRTSDEDEELVIEGLESEKRFQHEKERS